MQARDPLPRPVGHSGCSLLVRSSLRADAQAASPLPGVESGARPLPYRPSVLDGVGSGESVGTGTGAGVGVGVGVAGGSGWSRSSSAF
jgi:hypothetical protein